MPEAVIVSTARTPIGKAYRGFLNDTHGSDMGAHAVTHAVARAGVDPAEIEDVIMGSGNPEGATGSNIARQIALRAGLPVTVGGMTVNRFCSSGLQTIALAANQGIIYVLAMVVIGGLVGAGALGYDVVAGFSQSQLYGKGLAAGFAIVLLGVLLDRVTQAAAARTRVAS